MFLHRQTRSYPLIQVDIMQQQLPHLQGDFNCHNEIANPTIHHSLYSSFLIQLNNEIINKHEGKAFIPIIIDDTVRIYQK